MYVLDAHGAPQPVGVAGELCIGGIGVARGYWRQPALTAARFVPDPFSPTGGARLYRTGDQARWRADGELEFLGRLDQQIKLRGYRIEPGEIETLLRSYPAVTDAAVLVREDVPGDPRLVAYVAAPEGTVTGSALREYLKTQLPEYMVPASCVVLPTLPLSPAGKLDRPALPAPDYSAATAPYVPPADAIDLQLVRIWEELLAVQPIGITDNFFDLGGHSLLAVRLMGRINDAFDVDLPLTVLIEQGTIRAMAAELRERLVPVRTRSVLVPIQPGGSKPPLFCIHPAGGGVVCYVHLARHLGADQPVYGLQDPLFEENGYSVLSIGAFAEIYIDAIRRLQPQGPYHLAGWSFGGVVAFEMACQLRRRGQQVALLGVLDTPSPDAHAGFVDDEDTNDKLLIGLAREKAWLAGQTLDLPDAEMAGWTPQARVEYLTERLKAIGAMRKTAHPDSLPRLARGMWTRTQACQEYTPTVYDGRITLFRAIGSDLLIERDWPESTRRIYREATRGWSKLSSVPVEIRDVPGTHMTMGRDPHVETLAAALAECLARPLVDIEPATPALQPEY
jgi:thioesterase domain-containing protein/acyl carrier protein